MQEESYFLCDEKKSKLEFPELGGYCTSPNLYIKRTGKPDPFGILSESIFGPMNSYRCSCGALKNKTLDAGQVCPKCHVMCADNSLRLTTFGKIKLITPVFKTTKKNEIIKIIGKQNKQLLDPHQSDANAALSRYIAISQDKTEITIIRNLSDCPVDMIPVPFRIGGIFSLIFVLKFVSDVFKLESIKKLFDDRMIIDEIEVLPPDVRPVFKDPSKPDVLRYEEVNKFYISLLNSNKRNSLFYPTIMEEIHAWSEELLEKFKAKDFEELNANTIEYDLMSAFYQTYVDLIYNWAFEHIRGKEGLVRSTVLSRTLEFSGRTVVTVDPSVKPYQLRVPREMLFTLWFPYFLHYLTSKRIMKFDECITRVVNKKYSEIREDEEVFKYFLDFLKWFSESEEAMKLNE